MGPGPGVSSPSSPGVGVGVGESHAAEEIGENPNLLLWTEAFDNAVWTKSGVAVTPDAATDPLGGSLADALVYDPEGSIQQLSATAATTGAIAGMNHSTTAGWQRFHLTATFDGLPYTFSVYAKGGATINMAVTRSGGFLQVLVRNTDDLEGISVDLWGAQLEQAATFSTYQSRGGV